MRAARAHFKERDIPRKGAVGAGYAPPETVYDNKYNGLVCRGGIYAARCSHTDIATQWANCTERSRPFPTNRPEIGALPITAYLPVICREGS